MRIGLRHYAPGTVDWLRARLAAGDCTRTFLARGLCEREDWRNAKGEPCLASARAVLPKLSSAIGLPLPEARPMDGTVPESPVPSPDFPDRPLSCALEDLGEVGVVPVADAERGLARSMMATHHPRGDARCPGGRLRYWIRSSAHGVLGGFTVGAASWHHRARDLHIGWSQAARDANIGRVVNNDRFLLLPGVRVHGLASRALSLLADRVAGDWEGRYGVRPELAYSYVGPEHTGLSYRAAGWTCCRSPGRGPRMRVYARPLSAGWREALGRAPERVIGGGPPLEAGEDATWAETEYGRSGHSDARVRARLVRMGGAWRSRPGAPLPVIFPGEAERRAAYRFLSNPRVGVRDILEPHREAMAGRCRSQPVVLAVQDTTMLNHGGLEATEGLVGIGGGGSGSRGIAAHAGVAFSEGGRSLGVFSLDAGFRAVGGKAAAEGGESGRWTDAFAKAAELAAACPRTRVVSVCDREGDIWALLSEGRASADAPGGAGLLVRGSRSARRRALTADGGAEDLFDRTAGLDAVAERRIDIEACGGPRKRGARRGVRLELRAGFVDLVPPTDLPKGTAPLRMLAVRVLEPDPPDGREPLDWLLLTTEGGPDAENALRVVTWYGKRWLIEEWFAALKVGTRIRDRRLNAADDLRRCLAFDAITACTVMSIERLARSAPDMPARTVVHPDGIHVPAIHMAKPSHRRRRGPPDPDRTVAAFAVNTARLAGFIPSKRQPTPGTKKLWEGYLIPSLFVEHHRAMREYANTESTVLH